MKKALAGLLMAILILVFGIGFVIVTTDANTYRSQIADALGKQTGRTVTLQGPIKLGWSWHGATLTIQNASIGNPSWASRSAMAGIGSFELGVALLPLLSKQFVVTRLEIADADIQLETNKSGHGNWELGPGEPQGAKTPENPKGRSLDPVAIHVSGITVHDSRLLLRDQQGNARVFQVKNLKIDTQSSGAAFHFDGSYNGASLILNLTAGIKDLFAPSGTWPFEINLSYANYRLKAKGKANADKKQAEMSSYEIAAGNSNLRGKLGIDWSAHPALHGSLLSDRIDMADIKSLDQTQEEVAKRTAAEPSGNSRRLFTDAPLGLDILKSYNANFIIKIGALVMTNGTLEHITGKAELTNGVLVLNPFRAGLGKGEVEGQLKLNADIEPARMALVIKAPEVGLEDALRLLGAPDFLSGKASVDINLASSGDNAHALAANSVGVVSLLAGSGKVSSTAAGDIAAGLMELFAPEGSNNLNCLAARFIIKNGIAHDNGILVDTSSTTVAGNGGFDLDREVIDMTLHAKTKQINVGALVPPLRVRGTFVDPTFSIDPTETVQKVAGIFAGGSLDSNVPDIITQPGQNACLYTLDHPSAGGTSSSVLPSSITGKIGAGLKAIKGFLGQ